MTQNIFGKKALLDGLENGSIEHVNLTSNHNDLIILLKQKHIPFTIQNESYFSRFHKNLNHQGVVATIKNHTTNDLKAFLSGIKDKKNVLVLIVDGIEDPQNFGSILRTADAMHVDAVIYKKDRQVQINDFVSKSSVGAINYLNLIQVNNLANTINLLKEHQFWTYVTVLDDKSVDYSNVKYDKKSVLVVGNENNGVSSLLIRDADFKIYIPMYGHVQSLNVSVATGIVLSEIRKQIK